MIPPTLLQKMLTVAGVASLASPSSNTHPFASPIPWRKMSVRYNNNEIFFDIAEELRAIVNKSVLPGYRDGHTLAEFSVVFHSHLYKERNSSFEQRVGKGGVELQVVRYAYFFACEWRTRPTDTI